MDNQNPGCADFYTEVNAEETVFRWSIKNLLAFPFENGDCIESLKFSSVNTPETKWRLNIYPNGPNKKEYISVYLKLISPSKVRTKVTLSILNPKTNQYFKEFSFNHGFVESRSPKLVPMFSPQAYAPKEYYGYPMCCSHEDFIKAVGVQGENEVIVVCKIIALAKLEPTPSQCLVIGQKQESATSHTVDLSNLLLSKKFADFTFVSSDGAEFSAHKCILSIHSPVFSAMLENANMIESQQNRTQIADIDSLTLWELLQYIYTGKCDNLNTMAKQLLVASDKYQLTSLKVEAAQVLSRTISLENVLDICVTAHLHNTSELKKMAMDFIKLNLEEIVKISPSTWELFFKQYAILVKELICT